MWPIFLKILWVDINWNIRDITTESLLTLILVFNLFIFQILMTKKSIFRCNHYTFMTVKYALGSPLSYFIR